MTIRTYGGYLPLTGGTLTGVLGLPNGSVTAPSVNLGDTSTGFYRVSSNEIGVTINGTGLGVFYSGGISLKSAGVYAWGNGAIDSTIDLILLRTASAVLGVNDNNNHGFAIDVSTDAVAKFRNRANNADAQITAKTVLGTALTVGTLPAAASNAGAIAYVTDANANTRLSTVAAGGTNKVLVYSDGTNWLIA
jgi:hypothetical protein